MGERKVLNKYIPPDFDPSKIPRRKLGRKEDRQTKVRMMLPFSLRCNDCGNFIYKGTKFNATKETAEEDYLGLPIYRFHFRCPRCSNGLAMKTDPKNSDYVCELGATRNFEPWKEEERQAEGAKREREEEEAGDKMRELENRTADNKAEMDILNALDEMRALKARQQGVTPGQALAALDRGQPPAPPGGGAPGGDGAGDGGLTADEAAALAAIRARTGPAFIRRLEDDGPVPGPAAATAAAPGKPRAKSKRPAALVVVKKAPAKKAKPAEPDAGEGAATEAGPEAGGGGLLGLGAYGSDSDSE